MPPEENTYKTSEVCHWIMPYLSTPLAITLTSATVVLRSFKSQLDYCSCSIHILIILQHQFWSSVISAVHATTEYYSFNFYNPFYEILISPVSLIVWFQQHQVQGVINAVCQFFPFFSLTKYRKKGILTRSISNEQSPLCVFL